MYDLDEIGRCLNTAVDTAVANTLSFVSVGLFATFIVTILIGAVLLTAPGLNRNGRIGGGLFCTLAIVLFFLGLNVESRSSASVLDCIP